MMTYGLIESCDREFEEPDWVYSGCRPNGNPFSLSLKRFLTNLRLSPGDVNTRL